jgi:hypothetical protein
VVLMLPLGVAASRAWTSLARRSCQRATPLLAGNRRRRAGRRRWQLFLPTPSTETLPALPHLLTPGHARLPVAPSPAVALCHVSAAVPHVGGNARQTQQAAGIRLSAVRSEARAGRAEANLLLSRGDAPGSSEAAGPSRSLPQHAWEGGGGADARSELLQGGSGRRGPGSKQAAKDAEPGRSGLAHPTLCALPLLAPLSLTLGSL